MVLQPTRDIDQQLPLSTVIISNSGIFFRTSTLKSGIIMKDILN